LRIDEEGAEVAVAQLLTRAGLVLDDAEAEVGIVQLAEDWDGAWATSLLMASICSISCERVWGFPRRIFSRENR
jgi:hypothetical protein